MTTQLSDIFVNDTQLFKVATYDTDGLTPVTPLSCACAIWNRDTDAVILASTPGTVGSGYAQYNWAGSATAVSVKALLTVTLSSGVVKSEVFFVDVLDVPPSASNLETPTDAGDLYDVLTVRLEIGDQLDGAGVKPNGSHFTDAEILYWLEAEDGEVMRAAARACEALARHWSKIATYSDGPRSEQLGKIADDWANQAKALREQYGGSSGAAFSVGVTREDGYSEAAE
jgi:hypothetical protein